ncbi:hypothetical protein FA13DRAFT_491392 [Coprinellus micaceus]|uniref:Uncharacterized protein n=1 Tax=Coprinellus micaceus TaxID=71717 RepID=A0A4Y7SBJ4_COPMI|nr:hypothetical protein FA13DRAFT_491392 [Coprinellus micaceus]
MALTTGTIEISGLGDTPPPLYLTASQVLQDEPRMTRLKDRPGIQTGHLGLGWVRSPKALLQNRSDKLLRGSAADEKPLWGFELLETWSSAL